eukprot:6919025-Prymnesium_polylepis.1
MTSNGIKLLSVPESSLVELYAKAADQVEHLQGWGERSPGQWYCTKTVSIYVVWTHRGVERYAGVFPCFTFRRSKNTPNKHQLLRPKMDVWVPVA